MVENEPEYEIEEHEHKDGTKHSHKGGNKPHTHEKKNNKCLCSKDTGRNIRCPQDGDLDKI
jgi:hypothetical protein|tara:strand:+ start:6521 stop:6703 length:183 start_codon:yes stop_codon:yes gene_type:complete